jgi:RimJ/RimL family protein N-acetyltransferase
VLTPVIESERLLLDAVTRSDADLLLEYCQDAGIQRWIPVPLPYTRSDAETYVSSYARNMEVSESSVLWAIRVDGVFAGVIELRANPPGSATVGFWLGRALRGQGIMTEALETIVEYAFDAQGLGLSRIHWQALVGNIASATVARNAGFTFDGMQPASLEHRGEMLDSWQASLLSTDSRDPVAGWPL